jgi:hypothetical protein
MTHGLSPETIRNLKHLRNGIQLAQAHAQASKAKEKFVLDAAATRCLNAPGEHRAVFERLRVLFTSDTFGRTPHFPVCCSNCPCSPAKLGLNQLLGSDSAA